MSFTLEFAQFEGGGVIGVLLSPGVERRSNTPDVYRVKRPPFEWRKSCGPDKSVTVVTSWEERPSLHKKDLEAGDGNGTESKERLIRCGL